MSGRTIAAGALVMLLLASCNNTPNLVIRKNHTNLKEEAAFVLACVKASSADASESAEACMDKATELYTERAYYFTYPMFAPSGRANIMLYPCDLAETPEEKRVCRPAHMASE